MGLKDDMDVKQKEINEILPSVAISSQRLDKRDSDHL
jgi:hypothetical protein